MHLYDLVVYQLILHDYGANDALCHNQIHGIWVGVRYWGAVNMVIYWKFNELLSLLNVYRAPYVFDIKAL